MDAGGGEFSSAQRFDGVAGAIELGFEFAYERNDLFAEDLYLFLEVKESEKQERTGTVC